jgi:hypothetical protein
MKTVGYTDSSGYSWFVLVPDDATHEDYDRGIVIGPPDLNELGLDDAALKKLLKRLVDAEIVDAPTLLPKRPELINILNDLGIGKTRMREIVSIYQRDFYKE